LLEAGGDPCYGGVVIGRRSFQDAGVADLEERNDVSG
jgi:hypothetical protein